MGPGVEGLKYKATVHKSSASTDHAYNLQHSGVTGSRTIQAGRYLSRSNLLLQAGQPVRSDQVAQGSYSILTYLYFPSDFACFQASLFPTVLQTCCVARAVQTSGLPQCSCCQHLLFFFYEVPELQAATVWPLLRELSHNLSSTCHVNWTTEIHYLASFSVLP